MAEVRAWICTTCKKTATRAQGAAQRCCMHVHVVMCAYECMRVREWECMYVHVCNMQRISTYCMHVCLSVCVYACIYACMSVCMCVYMCACMYVTVCALYLCAHVCMCVVHISYVAVYCTFAAWVSVCPSVCLSVCLSVCMCVCMYVMHVCMSGMVWRGTVRHGAAWYGIGPPEKAKALLRGNLVNCCAGLSRHWLGGFWLGAGWAPGHWMGTGRVLMGTVLYWAAKSRAPELGEK